MMLFCADVVQTGDPSATVSEYALESARSGLFFDPVHNDKFRYLSPCHMINEPSKDEKINSAFFYDAVSNRMVCGCFHYIGETEIGLRTVF